MGLPRPLPKPFPARLFSVGSRGSQGFIQTALILLPRLLRPLHHPLPQTRPQAKALTIGKLMEIAPGGTMDPTPFIYDSTMYTMAGLMVRLLTFAFQ